jgi:hypothetical protein
VEYFRLPEQPAPMKTGREMSDQSSVKAHTMKIQFADIYEGLNERFSTGAKSENDGAMG